MTEGFAAFAMLRFLAFSPGLEALLIAATPQALRASSPSRGAFKNPPTREWQLHDQTTKLFLNAMGTHGTATEHTKNFLKYVAGIPTEDSFTHMIDTEVIKTKKEEKWRREYMTLEMELQKHRKEGRAEGIEEGMKKGLEKGMAKATEKTAMEMLRNKLDIELIRKCTRLSLKRIAELSKML